MKMKITTQIKILALFFLLINGKVVMGQITLKYTNDSVDIGSNFYCTDLGNNDYKYFYLDTNINGFRLYNMDMSPYMTVTVPSIVGNNTMKNGYMPIYITKALFDCDSTTIEYAYEEPNGNLNNPFYVFRTDGTLLLQVDSANGIYGFGVYGGSIDLRPIKNTSDGTILFLQHKISPSRAGVKIYSLCGNLPSTSIVDFSSQKSYVKVYPNPTTQQLNFEIIPPDNINKYEIVIYSNTLQELKKEKLNQYNNQISIDCSSYSSGIYYYSLKSDSKIFQTGKFVVSK